MTVKELIENLSNYDGAVVELKDKEGYFLCITNTKSVGITPYLDMPILRWYINDSYYDCDDYDSYNRSTIVSITFYLDVDAVNVYIKKLEVSNETTG